MKMQPSSRLILHGLVFGLSTFLAFALPPGAHAQALGEQYASPYESFSTSAFMGDEFCTGGDSFRSGGDCFSSASDEFLSPRIQNSKDRCDFNYAFSDCEQIDPRIYTWSDDPHDPFAARTTDSLPPTPSKSGPRNTFSFISVSDGPQIEAETKKNFEAPRAHPQYQEYYIEGEQLPQPIAGTTIFGPGDNGTQLYGWHYNHGQVRVYFAGDTGTVRDGLVKQTFISCMRDWCAPTEGLLRFTVVNDFRAADIVVCREFTTSHELAENMPSFRNGWLERVKIRLIDSTCDSLSVAQLRTVLLHSAGHALGYFGHTFDHMSAMNENCSHVDHPIQKLCPCDAAYIRNMYISYKTCWDNRFKKEPPMKVVRVPWGQAIPLSSGTPVPDRPVQCCQNNKMAKPSFQRPVSAQRGIARRLTRLPKKIAAGLE